ncbi:MAG TPA: hypothetical protein VH277_12155 [Gemmatimonadaceae bacterium]|nr:hypothetical protein [Gemmatimonadaceae bacterium]
MVGLAAATIAGCTDVVPVAPGPPAQAADAVIGAYGMATVDGYPLPMQIGYEGSTAVDALSGTIQLEANGNFRNILTYRTRGAGGVKIISDTLSGTFLHFENVLLLEPKDGSAPSFLDITDEKTLTSWDYDVIVYRR